MAFGGRQQAAARVSADRLASLSGGGAATAAMPGGGAPAQPRRVSVEPDLSRIRRNSIDETPEARKKRLAAKTVNYTATFLARIVIIAAAGYYGYELYHSTGQVHRGIAVGIFAMTADLGRVILKAMEPGSK